jgi:catechol 2,3-dioxygenase-like lactoylglutathione lyase family enzyme
MLHHVSVGVMDVERAARFYDAVLGALGYRRVMEFLPGAIAYGESKNRPQFWIGLPHDRNAASVGNGAHVGFIARSKNAVQKFHEAALAQGGSNNGEPGPRPDYGPEYYGAFVYDLDGNKIEATLYSVPIGKSGPRPARKTKAAKRSSKMARKAVKTSAKKKKKKARRR